MKEIPFELGKYRIVRSLGTGGMGEVYEALDTELDRRVAVKRAHEADLRDEKARIRFLEEAKIIAQINHPTIVQIYDLVRWTAGKVDDDAIVMELIEGESLHEVLRKTGKLSALRLLPLAVQIADGLAAAHACGVVHRDLKPANLMIVTGEQERIKILDFGLAQRFDRSELTEKETIVGTWRYMSPEQAAGAPLDGRSDLFSLGVLLYQTLSGLVPFDGDSLPVLIQQIREVVPVSLDRLERDVPRSLSNLVGRLLEKDPKDRPRSALEVAAAFRQIQLDSIAAPAPGGRTKPLFRNLKTSPPQADGRVVLRSLLMSETMDRAQLEEEIGDKRTVEIFQRYDVISEDLRAKYSGRVVELGSSLTLLFERPVSAVLYALAHQQAVRALCDETDLEIRFRIGIHLGDVVLIDPSSGEAPRDDGPLEVQGLVRSLTACLMRAAQGGQILLSQPASEVARRSATGPESFGEAVGWYAHGEYLLEGLDRSIEIVEVYEGDRSVDMLEESAAIIRTIEQRTVAGWRPAPGQTVKGRPQWRVERQLGVGGVGEVWLVVHEKTEEKRSFKFCYDVKSIHSLQREITLFRLLRRELGDRPDIARVLDWNLDEEPYFLEAEYTEGGSFNDWARAQGGLEQISLETRLELVAQAAEALAKAHSVGILHKDVKPSNILIAQDAAGRPRVRLTDFGIGRLTEPERLERHGITEAGLTEVLDPAWSSRSGTRMYIAPEQIEGKTPTLQADVYALGVVLYQSIVGDFTRMLAPGWDRDIDDEFLRKDIAAACDGVPERRLADIGALAVRLRTLDERRRDRDQRLLEREALRRGETERRRRRMFSIATVFLLFVVLLVGWLWSEADQEATRANQEALAAQETLDFLVDLFQSANPFIRKYGSFGSPELDPTVIEVLKEGLERSGKNSNPMLRGRLLSAVGIVHGSYGYFKQAEELIREGIHLLEGASDRESIEIAENLSYLGEVLLLDGRYDEASLELNKSFRILQKHVSEGDLRIAKVLTEQGRIDLAVSKPNLEQAVQKFQAALEIREVHGDLSNLAESKLDLAGAIRLQGDYFSAEKLYKESLQLYSDSLGAGHPYVAYVLNDLALLYTDIGRREEAQILMNQALQLMKNSHKRFRRHPAYAHMLDNAAFLGLTEDKETSYREAMDIRRDILGEDHWEMSFSYSNLGNIQADKKDFQGALGFFEKALAITVEREQSLEHAQVLVNMAYALQGLSLYAEAEENLNKARDIWPKSSVQYAYTLQMLAESRRTDSDWSSVGLLLKDAEAIYTELRHFDLLASLLLDWADWAREVGNCGVAGEKARQALEMLQNPDAQSESIERAERILKECSLR